ncbi:transcription elongation factor SPT6 homolog isoform X3 [Zea mays]|uniref:Transcription elongation factor spt6 n=1 Tax=Zea mays TaxID=4577 RepID=A0A804Q1U3_MAIZE|nr:transcription elongation factor SPT6 homolog isoform X3 [Zea mays]|eukprot:XP_020395195.1 transcription elongation factor SPT6 homolog isoform X3 [Zea mays]
MGRTVLSDEEEDEFEADEEDPRPSRRNRDDMDERDDDDDDDEDGQDEFEKDDFIVDDEEEEVEGEEEEQKSDDERRRKKKKKKRESDDFMLDEDDYMLLQDNNITGISRPKPGNKFKRLKKAGRESEMDEHSGFSDGDGTGKKRSGKERVEYSLFGDHQDAAPFEEDFEDDQQAGEGEEEVGDDEDEMADFIVEEDEIDGNGQVVRRKKFKKKVPRQAAGVSSSALQEAQDIFGDVDELLALRKQELEREALNSGELRGARLEDEFEPFILAEKYMTSKDEQIKENDVPERMQLSEELTGYPPTDKTTIEEESSWIHSHLTGDGFLSFFGNEHINKDIDQKDIVNVVTMLHANKFEIPFIAMYRKESCPTLLSFDSDEDNEDIESDARKLRWHKLLWAVQALDRKWLLLQKRKVALQLYYEKRFDDEKRRIDDVTRQELNSQLYNSIIEALKDAKSEKEVEDVDAKFNLHFPPGEVEEEGQFKRPKRKSLYSICHKAGLWEVANQFGRSAEQLGHHLTLTKIPEAGELESGRHSPEEVAANFTCAMFETSQDVLRGARHMVIFKIVEDHPRDVNAQMENFSIVYGDESVPRLYENSRISSDQLPGQSGIVKRAVALGRYLQNPLAMIATLCGPGKEILSWKLHALEQFLTPDEKYEIVEQVMVDATNQIGFDVNLAASHEWHFSTLQFIAGLGPRKASALQKDLVREGSIFSRKELVKPLGRKVFMNASGFLRVRRSGAAAASAQLIDLLEDTRIHPESYVLAKNLAKDVYVEDAQHEINEMDDEEQEMAIEHVRERPSMLRSLKIVEYIKSITEEYRKLETLRDIKFELLCGFSDWRIPYTEPSPDEEFWLLSGETDDTISEGRIVQVTVRNIQDNKIICTFDSGLKAIVMADNYSDEGFDPESSQLREGDVLTGKIRNVNKNRFMVYLTCKASEMRRRPFSRGEQDPYYHEQDMTSQTVEDKARKQKELAKKHFKPRMIVHPHFQNLTAEEAMQFLSDKEHGEKLIRPSSRGPSFLTLTLKIFDGVYAHKEIAESGKDHKDITSLLRLGKTLTIDNETFEDLDEVIDRYVDPLVGHLKSMLSYRKFRKGLKNEVDEMLRAEKAENPMRIVYSFGISHEHPGTFILSYIRSTNPHHEYIGLYPKGFRFRKRDFDNIDRLVSYFQKNIDKPPPDAGPSMRNVAAMVPMKNSAWGSGGGGDANGGWRGDGSNDRDRPFSGRSGGRFDSRNSSGGRGRGRGRGRGNFGDDDNAGGGWSGGGGGGNSGRWTDNIGTGGSGGSSWGGGGGGDDSNRGGGGGGWGSAGGGADNAGGGNGAWGAAAGGSDDPGLGSAKKVVPAQDGGTGWGSEGGGGGGGGGW